MNETLGGSASIWKSSGSRLKTSFDMVKASIFLPEEERTPKLNMRRFLVGLFISLIVSFASSSLLGRVVDMRVDISEASEAVKPPRDTPQEPTVAKVKATEAGLAGLAIERGEFARPVGNLPVSELKILGPAILAAAPLQQYDFDMKVFKSEFLEPGGLRLVFLLSDEAAGDPAKLSGLGRYADLCISSELICAALDMSRDPAYSSTKVIDKSIPLFSIQPDLLLPFLLSVGFDEFRSPGVYIFDKDGQLVWFGPMGSLAVLYSVADVVVRTTRLTQVARVSGPNNTAAATESIALDGEVLAEETPSLKPGQQASSVTGRGVAPGSGKDAETILPESSKGDNKENKTPLMKGVDKGKGVVPSPEDVKGSIVSQGVGSVPDARPGNQECQAKLRISDLKAHVTEVGSGVTTTLQSAWAITEARRTKRPVLLSFWGTWCLPCIKEMPDLARLNKHYGKDVLFVGLAQERNTPESRDLVQEMVREHGLKLQYLSVDSSMARRVFRSSEDVALPAFALFDSQGNLVDCFSGSIGQSANMDRLVKRLDSFSGNKRHE